jgi:hypothetical protein
VNRLVLIGNGFDLAHGLKTKYEDFMYWYWRGIVAYLVLQSKDVYEDTLCKVTNRKLDYWNLSELYHAENEELYSFLVNNDGAIDIYYSPMLERINKSIQDKGWVDIENEYYELLKNYVLNNESLTQTETLNTQLHYLQEKLVEYLKSIEISEKILRTDIRPQIYAPFKIHDISIESLQALINHVKSDMEADKGSIDAKLSLYGDIYSPGRITSFKEKFLGNIVLNDELPIDLLLPNNIMLLSFNYTHTADLYCKKGWIFTVNQIHGDLDNPESVIFGYGDELDNNYKSIVDKNENKFLGNIKSIKYLESDNYRKLLSFIESEPYQILIMGHSCGNSDRTLLNTLFEHKNCVSIKPYYYKWGEGEKDDNYIELVQNISRNFTDMKLMRDRVVNKTYCEQLTTK